MDLKSFLKSKFIVNSLSFLVLGFFIFSCEIDGNETDYRHLSSSPNPYPQAYPRGGYGNQHYPSQGVSYNPYATPYPASRTYYNPYNFRQTQSPYGGPNPYYDYDQYYVPPSQYYNYDNYQSPTNSGSITSNKS